MAKSELKNAMNRDSDTLYQAGRIFRLMPPSRKKQFALLIVLMLFLAFFETAAVGLIAFYAAAISDPVSILQTSYIDFVRTLTSLNLFETPRMLITILSITVIAMILLKNSFRGGVVYAISRFSASLEAIFGHRLLDDFLARDYQWHLTRNSADTIQAVQWRRYLGRFFLTPCLNILSETFVLLVLVVALVAIQPVVSIVFVVFQGGFSLFFYRKLRKNLDRNAEKCKEMELAINRELTRSIHGFKEVKISGTAHNFISSFDGIAFPFSRIFGWQQFWKEAPLLTLESVGFLMICGVILFMLHVLRFSPLEITGATALLAVAAWRTLPALNRVVAGMTQIRTALPYIRTVLEYIDDKTAGQDIQLFAAEKMPFEKEIVLKGISFSYDSDREKKVLDHFDLVIPKGKAVGIMGPSGCGKSTLIDVLVGLLNPKEGAVMVDGKPLDQESFPSWVKNIGYVPQFPYIFDGTLAENVAFGIPREMINREQVSECCRLAAIDFLDELPHDIDSLIGERGIRLSGGQRQRVSIARALYRNPSVLVFDEATSSLDEENDQKITRLILSLRGEQTLIVVAHRASTLENCDTVIQMNDFERADVVEDNRNIG